MVCYALLNATDMWTGQELPVLFDRYLLDISASNVDDKCRAAEDTLDFGFLPLRRKLRLNVEALRIAAQPK